MARSPYAGYTKKLGCIYKNRKLHQCHDREGNFMCPKCKGTTSFEYEGEHLQYGFPTNKYMEFNRCRVCNHRFCIVMLRKEEDYVSAH